MLLLPTNKGPGKPSLLTTRRGTIAVAAGVAALAGVLLMVFVSNYRSSVAGEGEPAGVLVANALIEQGSAGQVLATERRIRTASVRADQVKEGAVTDPATLRGKVAVRDVLPGQQLMATDFGPAGNAVSSRLGSRHRALSVPVDGVHGLKGALRVGDRVDVYASFGTEGGGATPPVLRRILPDILVLNTGAETEEGGGDVTKLSSVVLRVPADKVTHVAFTADHGKVWLALRPGAGARDGRAPVVTLKTVMSSSDGASGSEEGGQR
jgi:Flp pilus assembly protein CpaB